MEKDKRASLDDSPQAAASVSDELATGHARQIAVNSKQYWDGRFRGDWQAKRGRRQTAFFCGVALANTPAWLLDDVRERRLSICDWGCALGDAVQILGRTFPDSAVSGYDISTTAIREAHRLYPGLNFSSSDDESCENVDVLFSSNTLEHFTDPVAVMERLSERCTQHMWFLVPFQDYGDIDEHFFAFDYDNIPRQVGEDFVLSFFSNVDVAGLPETEWRGKQAILVYTKEHLLPTVGLRGCEGVPPGFRESFVSPSTLMAVRRLADHDLALAAAGERDTAARLRLAALESERIRSEERLAASAAVEGENARLAAEFETERQVHLGEIAAAAEIRLRVETEVAELLLRQEELLDQVAACEQQVLDAEAGRAQEQRGREDARVINHHLQRDLDASAARVQALEGQLGAAKRRGAELRLNSTVAFPFDVPIVFDHNGPGFRFLGDGWSELEQWGVWSNGTRATLRMRVGLVSDDVLIVLHGQFPRAPGGRPPAQQGLKVTVNNKPVAVEIQAVANGATLEALLPQEPLSEEELVVGWRFVDLTLEFENPIWAYDLGESGDQRRLGFGLFNAQLIRKPRSIATGSETGAPSDVRRPAAEVLSAARPALGEPGLVSIVLPVYNHADLLPIALRSVLDQTYENWELIVINDGSSDDFHGAVLPFVGDPRIRVFDQPNQKLPAALNNGFDQARGEFLTWTSADNIMLPNQIERLVAALVEDQAAGLAYSDYLAIDDRGQPLVDPQWRAHNRPDGSATIRLPDRASVANFHVSGDNFLGASFLYRREVAEVVGKYNDATFGGEDYDFWLRMNMVTTFRHVGEVLYRYRVHDNTLSARAHELDLFANIRTLLDADRRRREGLLSTGALLEPSAGALWRSGAQYTNRAAAFRLENYTAGAPADHGSDGAAGIIVDVPLNHVEIARLAGYDVVLTQDEATYFWLKPQLHPEQRLLFGEAAALHTVLMHVAAMRNSERADDQRSHKPHHHRRRLPPAPPSYVLPKSVLLMLDTWGTGGLEQVVLDLAQGFASRGIRTTIGLAQATEIPRELEASDVQTSNGLVAVEAFAGDQDRLRRHLRAETVDIVNYHHCLFGLDVVNAAGVPAAYTFHNSYVWFQASQIQRWRQELAKATLHLAVSRQVGMSALQMFGIRADRLSIVPNGVELPQMLSGRESHDRFHFLAVASFNRLKMQGCLLQAFRRVLAAHPDAYLTMIGFPVDQGYFNEIRSIVEATGLRDNVSVIPGESRSRVLQRVANADALVSPSIVEGWSLAMTEAAALGVPIVASDVGSARDLQQAGAAVLLVAAPVAEPWSIPAGELDVLVRNPPDRFVEDLADTMLTAIAARDVSRSRATRAAADIAEQFSKSAMVNRYLDQFVLVRALRQA